MLGDVLKDDGAETRLGTRVSGNNGRINRKSLEKSLDGVKTAWLQLGARWITGLCQRERARRHMEKQIACENHRCSAPNRHSFIINT